MKKFIIPFLLLLCMMSCESDDKHLRYKKGDIVYLKPDSTQAVVLEVDETNSDYSVKIGEPHPQSWFQNTIRYTDDECVY